MLGNNPLALSATIPKATTAETTGYDPRYERAQTIEGAKARYVADDCPAYGIERLEADIERLLRGGDHPDGRDEPLLDGCSVVV